MTSPKPSEPARSDRPVRFAAIGLDHAHIFGQTAGLIDAGAELVACATHDQDADVARQFFGQYPDAPVRPMDEILAEADIELVVTAAVPADRAGISLAAMRAGKDVVSDKPGCTTPEQLADLRAAVVETGRFWSVTFSERFQVPAVARAGELVREGKIGTVVHTLGLGPHREHSHLAGGAGRPDWFYDESRYGGILIDIASHQIDQFLWFTGSTTAEVAASDVANVAHPDQPGLQDFGDLLLRSATATGYIRVDWFTPAGLPTWGDGRLLIMGTEGYIELRKYVDIGGEAGTNHVLWVDAAGVHRENCEQRPITYYREVLADVRNRTSTACDQEHTFEVMRLALAAQAQAQRRGNLR